MKPSEALRKAPEEGIIQWRGSFGTFPNLCAIGAMCHVAGVGRDFTDDYERGFGVDFFEELPKELWPEGYTGSHGPSWASLFDAITWMNDTQNMRFEDIALWLEGQGL